MKGIWNKYKREFVVLIATLAMCVVFTVLNKNFLNYSNFLTVLQQMVLNGILAVGMMFTIITGGIDLSVGCTYAITGIVVASCTVNYGMNPFLAILVGILIGAVLGAFNGFLVAKLNIQPMVATLILYTAGRGIAQLITDGQITYIRVGSYKVYGGYIGKCPVPTPIFIAIIVVVITYLVLKKTALGLYIESVGINGTASRLVGLNSTMIKFLTYVICGVLAGIAGIVASSRIYSADANNIGLNLEMDAILAVALGGNALGGGKFSLMGSVIGAYTIQALTTTLYAMNVSADQLPVYKAIVVIIIVTLQSPVFQKFMTSQKMKRANKAVEGGNN